MLIKTRRFYGVCAAVVSVHAILVLVALQSMAPTFFETSVVTFQVVEPTLATAQFTQQKTKIQNQLQNSSHKSDVLKPISMAQPTQQLPKGPPPAMDARNEQIQSVLNAGSQAVDQHIVTSHKGESPSNSKANGETRTQVELPSKDAEYLHHAVPVYPAISQRLNEQGKALVHVLISSTGLPLRVELLESSGFDRLDRSAVQAVQGWRFVPGRRQGVAEEMWFTVPVNFQLTN